MIDGHLDYVEQCVLGYRFGFKGCLAQTAEKDHQMTKPIYVRS